MALSRISTPTAGKPPRILRMIAAVIPLALAPAAAPQRRRPPAPKEHPRLRPPPSLRNAPRRCPRPAYPRKAGRARSRSSYGRQLRPRQADSRMCRPPADNLHLGGPGLDGLPCRKRNLIKTESPVQPAGQPAGALVAPVDSTVRGGRSRPAFPLAKDPGRRTGLAMGDPGAVPAGKYGKGRPWKSLRKVWSSVKRQGRARRRDVARGPVAAGIHATRRPLGIVYASDAVSDPGRQARSPVFSGGFPSRRSTYPRGAARRQPAIPPAAAFLTFLEIRRGAAVSSRKQGFQLPAGVAGPAPPEPRPLFDRGPRRRPKGAEGPWPCLRSSFFPHRPSMSR